MANINYSNSNNINDQEEHYKSLISLVKYCITIASIILTIVGLMTYTTGQEIRAEMKAERLELKDNITEMKADLKDQESELKDRENNMRAAISELNEFAKQEVNNTKEQANNQISGIRNLATEEARSRVNEVFKERNLDQFIEQTAQERIEPRVQFMVDEKMKQIQRINDQKLENNIKSLSNPNMSIAQPAINYLQLNQEDPFLQKQIDEIIEQFKKLNDGSPIVSPLLEVVYNINQKSKLSEKQISEFIQQFKQLPTKSSSRPPILEFLNKFNNDIVETFFENLAFNRFQEYFSEPWMREVAVNHFCSLNHLEDFIFYKNYLNQYKNSSEIVGEYQTIVGKLSFVNPKLTFDLLNDKELVDSVFRHMSMFYDIELEHIKRSLRWNINKDLPKDEIDNTFYFSYVPSDIKIYPKYNPPPARHRQ